MRHFAFLHCLPQENHVSNDLMTVKNPHLLEYPVRIANQAGLVAEFNANGSLRRMDLHDVMVSLFLGNEAEGGPATIWLRQHHGQTDCTPLTGPMAPSAYDWNRCGMTAIGTWGSLKYTLTFTLAAESASWFWQLEVENTGSGPCLVDAILTQDLGLAHYGAIRLNEYYVSQYIDHTPLQHPTAGVVLASRQNQSMGGNFPWALTGCTGGAVSFATDAMQVHGRATRCGEPPTGLRGELPGRRLQHEHSMAAVQAAQHVIPPGGKHGWVFFGHVEITHPEVTGPDDLVIVDRILSHPLAKITAMEPPAVMSRASDSWFSGPLLECQDLDEADLQRFFPGCRLHAEMDDGILLSFFGQEHNHIVLRAKERLVLRPHGHILRSGGSFVPDEAALTTTCWMGGVFHSMVTQGHVSINRFLSTCHSYLGLFRSHGQRVFVEIDGRWHLLDQPSAFEMWPDRCRWIYRHKDGILVVTSHADESVHRLRLTLEVLDGPARRFFISHHVSLHGDDGSRVMPVSYERRGRDFRLTPAEDGDVGRRFPDGAFVIRPDESSDISAFGGDECLFEDGVSRRQPYFCLVSTPTRRFGLEVFGELIAADTPSPSGFWEEAGMSLVVRPTLASHPAARLEPAFRWFVHNALVHYLSPRGLEQYSGGGWGTRDVCQGAVEALMAMGRFDPVADILRRVFRQQNTDGDWPQWFMFFERERNIRPGDSHGDIVYWPILALAQYLSATRNHSLLDEETPYFSHDPANAETTPIREHVERALQLMARRVLDGTHLAAYGHGDWNDALQPARPDMRDHLCSSWTVTLNYQTIRALAAAFRSINLEADAEVLDAHAEQILAEFQQHLIVNEVIAGFAYHQPGQQIEYLLHPDDSRTGLKFSLLPMIHAIINDMLPVGQAQKHLDLIRRHLCGPDGAHLFDRPLPYQGGRMSLFQRAETASYFGREIGIMYTHAHLRYAEALARFGDADGFFHALCQANPVGMREMVPSAAWRQSNCYYSSSDPAFADRYEAFENYDRVRKGEIPLEGGWRVYSSGAGIGARLIVQQFLGLRLEAADLLLDPVIPAELDGLRVKLRLGGIPIEAIYHIGVQGCGPLKVRLNGATVQTTRLENPYRVGGVRIPAEELRKHDLSQPVRLDVQLG